MTAADRAVKRTYLRLFYITGVAHDLHNAFQRIRANYWDVDKLIAAVKVLVVKNKDQSKVFGNHQFTATRNHQMRKLAEGGRILCQKLSASS